jgi:anaerobic ribonucleoside-triphosphate reductase
MARNTVTGQTIKSQDLNNIRYTKLQRGIAQEMADKIAQNMSARTNQQWVGFLKEYTPRERV